MPRPQEDAPRLYTVPVTSLDTSTTKSRTKNAWRAVERSGATVAPSAVRHSCRVRWRKVQGDPAFV